MTKTQLETFDKDVRIGVCPAQRTCIRSYIYSVIDAFLDIYYVFINAAAHGY